MTLICLHVQPDRNITTRPQNILLQAKNSPNSFIFQDLFWRQIKTSKSAADKKKAQQEQFDLENELGKGCGSESEKNLTNLSYANQKDIFYLIPTPQVS